MKQDLRIAKGLETKNKILNCAKAEFYKNGYKRAKISDIAAAAGVPIGLFTYYFKTKSTIVVHIHDDFMSNIKVFVKNLKWAKYDTPLFNYTLQKYIYYETIFSDQNVLSFFYESVANNLNYESMCNFLKCKYEEYIRYYNLDISPQRLEILVVFDSGGELTLILKYIEEKLPLDKKQFIEFSVFNDASLSGIPKGEIQRVSDKIMNKIAELDLSSLSLLNQRAIEQL